MGRNALGDKVEELMRSSESSNMKPGHASLRFRLYDDLKRIKTKQVMVLKHMHHKIVCFYSKTKHKITQLLSKNSHGYNLARSSGQIL